MNKFRYFVVIGLLSVTLSACGSSSPHEDQLPNYAFTLDEYVTAQEGEIDSINLSEYLPNKKMVLVYTTPNMEDFTTTVSVEPLDDAHVVYREESSFSSGMALNGTFYYDEKGNYLARTIENGNGTTHSDVIYMAPVGKMLEEPEGVTIQDVPYLYTVTTQAGTFENCICVVKEDTTSERKVTFADYYAKGIGRILAVSNFSNGEYSATDELCFIEEYSDHIQEDPYIEPQIPAEVNEISIPDNEYFFDGQRFQCFQTASGADVTLTIRLFYDRETQLFSYKGEMSDGMEFWFDWQFYDFETEETQFKINCQDNSSAFLIFSPNISEIKLIAENGDSYGNMFDYSGTYIALPDTVE